MARNRNKDVSEAPKAPPADELQPDVEAAAETVGQPPPDPPDPQDAGSDQDADAQEPKGAAMTNEEAKQYAKGLIEEMRGYELQGKSDRVEQVQDELRRLASIYGPPHEQAEKRGTS